MENKVYSSEQIKNIVISSIEDYVLSIQKVPNLTPGLLDNLLNCCVDRMIFISDFENYDEIIQIMVRQTCGLSLGEKWTCHSYEEYLNRTRDNDIAEYELRKQKMCWYKAEYRSKIILEILSSSDD